MIWQNTKTEFLSFHKNTFLISIQTFDNAEILSLCIYDKENKNSFCKKMLFVRNDLF